MTQITYGSVCSGIEAASVAWEPLGWEPLWFSEIEPFPSAVLAHHWPQVPNLGDFTGIRHKLADGTVEPPDVLVGGTPCQAYSVAGLRKSLDDARGQLTLQFVGLANAIDHARSLRGRNPCTIVWENVPGVLSTKDNAFGCFLGDRVGAEEALVPGACPDPGKSSAVWRWDRKSGKHVPSWPVRGVVSGPRRSLTWRVLDAQWFGVAQRRRRVFVVASAGTICPEKVLFEFDGVRRDSPPSRQQGQGTAADVAPYIGASGRGFERTGETRGQDPVVAVQGFQGDIARTLQARHDSSPCVDRGMDVVAVQDVAATLRRGSTSPSAHGKLNGTDRIDLVVHTLAIRGRGDHRELETRDDGTANALLLPNGGRDGIGCGAIAFNARQDPDSWEGRTGPLDTDGGTQAVGIPALAGCVTTREGNSFDPESTTMIQAACFKGGQGSKAGGLGYSEHVAPTLSACPSGTQLAPTLMQGMQVRRLTPTECARLQGFPDHHARIPWNHGYWAKGSCSEEARAALQESCPDGPQYKAYGNSMAVPVMSWIGKRLDKCMKVAT